MTRLTPATAPAAALATVMALCAAPVLGQTGCANAMAQMELNQCAYADWEAADARLNQTYGRVVAAYGELDANLPDELGSAVDTLRQAQRHWIDFRDTTCAAEGFQMRGGSAEPLVIYGCMRVLTEERIGHLEGMLDAFGG